MQEGEKAASGFRNNTENISSPSCLEFSEVRANHMGVAPGLPRLPNWACYRCLVLLVAINLAGVFGLSVARFYLGKDYIKILN